MWKEEGILPKAKFVWMVDNAITSCDIRRYAHSHREAIAMVSNPPLEGWHLYKLVKVNKRKAK